MFGLFSRDKAEEGMVNRDETGREIRSGELVLLQNGEVAAV